MEMGKNPSLLLVDIQYGLDDWEYYGGNRNNPDAEKKYGADPPKMAFIRTSRFSCTA